MSDNTYISAEIREDVGKGASRRLRRAGKIPAVIYGGEKDAVTLTLEHREILHATENESFFSSILEIKVADGRTQKVVVRDMHRHPYKQLIMHLDFMRVSDKEKLRISLPLHFIGEEESEAGKSAGVVIQHQMTEIEVEALPSNLPEFLEVDLSGLEPGSAVMLADIKLPEGVEVPSLTDDEDSNVMVANAIHISESQGTGAAAAAEAEEAEALEAAGEEATAEDAGDADAEDGEAEAGDDKE
ncbi:50S ribosomal protein L25/general stress protein Ctc [Marinihelvus fidelis]|uniref:Large ribosomal subunit protein bL25 n=1 Tax=Marinihelvus fidelis TaxID=2613842 RepID=A0A5N0TCI1_9GAMM|nr:50S ribosomal protein L25/general stress protein Ctc [Marinihelvus fidelis]KAA9132461.1 50S ribosomal protein L25/general stress protein Ctc [Marinihelvus fidelis]